MLDKFGILLLHVFDLPQNVADLIVHGIYIILARITALREMEKKKDFRKLLLSKSRYPIMIVPVVLILRAQCSNGMGSDLAKNRTG